MGQVLQNRKLCRRSHFNVPAAVHAMKCKKNELINVADDMLHHLLGTQHWKVWTLLVYLNTAQRLLRIRPKPTIFLLESHQIIITIKIPFQFYLNTIKILKGFRYTTWESLNSTCLLEYSSKTAQNTAKNYDIPTRIPSNYDHYQNTISILLEYNQNTEILKYQVLYYWVRPKIGL